MQVLGRARFLFPNEQIADVFASQFTFNNFFTLNSAPVSDLTPFQTLTYTGGSPGRNFTVAPHSRSVVHLDSHRRAADQVDRRSRQRRTPANWSLGVPSSTNPAVPRPLSTMAAPLRSFAGPNPWKCQLVPLPGMEICSWTTEG